MSDPITVTLGDYPHTKALKSGALKTALTLSFPDIKPTNRAFKPMVMEQKFDVCELAIMTFLMAKAYGKPIALLPAVMAAHFPHGCLFYNPKRGTVTLADLAGKRIATRSYAQTTPAWLRGIVANDYGIDWHRWKWITFEGAHVTDFTDPPEVERGPAGRTLTQLLQEGEADAAIFGLDRPDDPAMRTVIPDPAADAAAWKKKHGFAPVNHVVVVTEKLLKTRPDAVRELYGLMLESKKASGSDLPFGVAAIAPAMDLAIEFAYQQKLIPRRFTVAELFDDTTRMLGA